ncbi:multidrug effflux MFS transporter [Rhodoluna sp. KAS3]|uniref:multidrug effflux MFS transporter n=1 Tax=Rhodoluna sp. KAS3 TaxID=942880 RepID=UPI00222EF1C0|nr:multidrug effflux MFS transporter [Rhodoluna sp. KAS3]BDS49594.1 Bcr/CflA family drug resistance efflux transporter [Rhodoluna sp. KAS3]
MSKTIGGTGRIKMILLIGALGMLQPFTVDPYIPSLPAVSDDLAVDPGLIQLTLSAVSLGFAFGMLLAGPVSDAIGRKRPMLIALAIYIASSLLCALAPGLEVFFAARILQGLSGAALTVIGNAMLRDLYTGMPLLKMMSRVMLINAASWFLGPLIGSGFLQFTDWRGISLFVAIFAGVLGVIAFLSLPETLKTESRRDEIFKGMGKRFRNVLRDRSYTGLLIIQMLISASVFAYLSVTPFVFANTFDVPATEVGLYLGLNSFGAYLGIQASSKLAQYIPAQWLLTGSLILAAIVGLLLIVASNAQASFWTIEGLIFGWLFLFGATNTPVNALALSPHGSEAGTAASLIGAVGFLGTAMAGPYYTTLDKFSAVGVGTTWLIFMVIAIVVMFVVVRPNKIKPLT